MVDLYELFPFQVSRGLWQKYGDKRIVDTPISEVSQLYFTGYALLLQCMCCGSILCLVQIFFSFVFGYGNI